MIDQFGAFRPDPISDTVTISRAQHEALRYAARILATERPGHPAIVALRAAGILEGE